MEVADGIGSGMDADLTRALQVGVSGEDVARTCPPRQTATTGLPQNARALDGRRPPCEA